MIKNKTGGFGQVLKAIMIDKSITIEAKAIFAYLCSFCGGKKNISFPSRDRIINELKVCKQRYYRHYNMLLLSSYMTKEKMSGYINKNQYVLQKVDKGYGIVPKAVMSDE